MFIDRSKFRELLFKRVPGTFLCNYFKIWPAVSGNIFQEFLHVGMEQVALIHNVYRCIKILQTIFNNSHTMNVSMKLFQNLTSGYRGEDFSRISSGQYSASSPHSPEPRLLTDQNFANNFWQRSLKEHFCEIISKSDMWFQRKFLKNFFMSVQCK